MFSAIASAATIVVVAAGSILLQSQPVGLEAGAPTADEALVADLAAVMSEPYDAARVAALYAPDAVIHETTANTTQRGLDQIGARIREFEAAGFEAVATSAPIRNDDFVAAFHRYGTGGDLSGRALVLYEFKDGLVLNQWIYPADPSVPVAGAISSGGGPSPAADPDEALVADLAAVESEPYVAARVASLYAPDAVIHETTANTTQRGLDEIAARLRDFEALGFDSIRTSAPIVQDDFVAAFYMYGTGGDLSGRALVLYEFKDGLILNQWVYPADAETPG